MKLTEALEVISTTCKSITRPDWYGYNLRFNGDGYLILKDHNSELTPYVLSVYDFNYDWEILEYCPLCDSLVTKNKCIGEGCLYSTLVKINTSYICPPIPCRDFDWISTIDGQEEDGITGFGATEAEAIKDLQDTLINFEEK